MSITLEYNIRTTIRSEISRLKEGAIAPEEVPDDLPLFDVNEDGSENLGLDSLDALELAMAIEEKYEISVPQDIDFKQLVTLNDVVAYVHRGLADGEES